ncbi:MULTISPECIES: YihY/virulence factor BrkB family protein [Spirulina sp. CCY15215]|uniref:YihY/virulence factor BrkB family protein n=1 Tax=Spirulina sp. CCY15215 TaxID=2767591 RepID=UPI00195133DC|nr:YihY/virulence factor BrkB family protein [Spirulina major]
MPLPHFFRFFSHLNWLVIRTIIARIFRQRLAGLSAEMAYNSLLALFPAILALITAIALFEDPLSTLFRTLIERFGVVQDESLGSTMRGLAANLKIVAPDLVWELLSNFVTEITRTRSTGLFSASFAATLWISSAAIGAAMNALDRIHEIPRHKRRPWWHAKIISLLLTLASIGLLLIASFLVLVGDVLVKFAVRTIEALPIEELEIGSYWLLKLWQQLNWPFALSIAIVAFALIYRLGPSQWRRDTPILPGAMLAAFAWAGISLLFRVYVDNFGAYNKVYGAVGAVIVLMLWLYLTSLVFLIGGVVNVTVGEAMKHKTIKKRPRDRPTLEGRKEEIIPPHPPIPKQAEK